MYVRKGTKLAPFIIGGHQERNLRAGTENTAGIVGFGKACELATDHIEEENDQVRKLRDRLEKQLLSNCKDSVVNGRNRLPNTLNISFKNIEGESILIELDDLGICASPGSACTSGSFEPSHVLRAMGSPFTLAHGAVRFSLSRYTTEAEIDYVSKKLPIIVERLRAITPFFSGASTEGFLDMHSH